MMSALPQPLSPPNWMTEPASDQQIVDAMNSRGHRERWKYTSARPILELVYANGDAPDIAHLPQGATLQRISRTDRLAPISISMDEAPEAYAALCASDAVFLLTITGHLAEPIELHHTAAAAPLIIELAAGASADLRETWGDGAAQHQVCWLRLDANSVLTHSRNGFATAKSWQYLQAQLQRDARYVLHNHAAGSELHRQDIVIDIRGEGAHAEVASAAYVGERLHLDQHISITHHAPHSSSNQRFHNIAADGAKLTFNGRIHIRDHANGVAAHLTNKNLSLGDSAIINTKPELEIYTDDVKCSHGATVGRIDPNSLFYCASRGIDPLQTRRLLSRAFLAVCATGPLGAAAMDVFGSDLS